MEYTKKIATQIVIANLLKKNRKNAFVKNQEYFKFGGIKINPLLIQDILSIVGYFSIFSFNLVK